jgi:hypothetical protein
VSQVTSLGQTATLSVNAFCGALSYQWRLNGVAIAGATSSTRSITNLNLALVGNSYVVITGGGGSVASAVARVVLTDFNLRPVVSIFGNQCTQSRVDYSDHLTNGPWLALTSGILGPTRQDVIDFTNTNTMQRSYLVVLLP